MSKKFEHIVITAENKKRLKALGVMGDSFNSVLEDLLDSEEKRRQKKEIKKDTKNKNENKI